MRNTKIIDGREYVFSEKAYDYSSEQTLNPDGTITFAVTGCYVLTAEECEKALTKRDGGMK